MAFDLISILTASRSLRRACEARAADRDNAEAEAEARTALLKLSYGMGMTLHPERPARWTGTDAMSRDVEAAASSLAELADGDWQNAGAIALLAVHFGAIASRMGCTVEADRAAQATVEGYVEAAE